MNLILSEKENKLKEWSFVDRTNGLEFTNNVVITDKRFIYQKELVNSQRQRSVNRFDVGVDNVKAVNGFYGSKQNKLWLIIGIVGILALLLGVLMILTEEIEMGIAMCVIGLIATIVGFFLHSHPDKSPINVKKPNFRISIETKTPDGSTYGLGAGHNVVLNGKRRGVLSKVLYYLVKKKSSADGLEMPEDVAIEVIETLGSLIF